MYKKKGISMSKITIYTIGHSTHAIEKFIAILKIYGIEQVVDIRTIAKSHYNPQFNDVAFKKSLHHAHISYLHLKGLGGLRRTTKQSINTAWRNASLRGYADYMQTEEFKKNLLELLDRAKKYITVIMCAEALPWRCHRSLIGDALLTYGIEVLDIFNEHSAKPHTLTPWARINGHEVTYPGD
jgi:uncharacterized protein (DUF488 family)